MVEFCQSVRGGVFKTVFVNNCAYPQWMYSIEINSLSPVSDGRCVELGRGERERDQPYAALPFIIKEAWIFVSGVTGFLGALVSFQARLLSLDRL